MLFHMDDLIKAFVVQAGYCNEGGAPTYGFLCQHVADDIKKGGPSRELLHPWPGSVKDDNIALRLMGGLHRLALDGRAQDLARHFQTCGGDGAIEPTWTAAERLLVEETETLKAYLEEAPQTNEVMRSAALLPGFLTVASRTGLPLRCLELGASGGLNQVWDQHHYDYGAFAWGSEAAPLGLTSTWTGPVPSVPGSVKVLERAACDISPIDLSTENGRQRLRSYVWPDQPERMARLVTAMGVAQDLGVTVEQADAGAWLEDKLSVPSPDVATVIYHSIAWQYFPPETQRRAEAAIRKAMEAGPVFWLTMEIEERRAGALPKLILTGNAELNLRSGDTAEELAEVHFHGGFVNWTG